MGLQAATPEMRWKNDVRWASVEKVLASKAFEKSVRLRAFLTYICSCAIDGRTEEITEQQIGIAVFERPADYNPGEDNIVRNAARQLRQRLAVYYQEEAPAEQLRIEVPKGGYVPVFLPATVEDAPEASAQVPVARRPVARDFLFLAAGILAALLGVLGFEQWHRHARMSDRLWSQLFQARRPALLVVGDAGVNMFNNLSRGQVPVDSYIEGKYLDAPEAKTPEGYSWTSFARRRYTSMADLRLTEQVLRLPQVLPEALQIRSARDIRIDDLKSNNVILSGAATYNPWVQLFDKDLNFRIDYSGVDNRILVRNKAPKLGSGRSMSGMPTIRRTEVMR